MSTTGQNQISVTQLQQRRQALLRRLANAKPFIQGTLVKVGTRCGNPNCRCARGEKHEAWHLSRSVNGRTKTSYVPVELHEEVAAWTQEYQRIREVLEEVSRISEQIMTTHVARKRARQRNQAVGPKNDPSASAPSM